MKRSFVFLTGASALLAGCITAPKAQKSEITTPAVWHTQTSSGTTVNTSTSTAVDQTWWRHFEDATLDAVVQEALRNNQSLKIARARVEEARAARGVARSALMPQVNGVATASRGNLGVASNDQVVGQAQAGFDASWEIDLFGHNQARSAEAQALYQSAQANEQAVMVGLLAEVARNYFDLRNYERQIEITRQNLENQKKTLNLINAQVQGAMASDFDAQRAGAQVSTTESQIPTLQSAYDATLNRLNVLLGYPPGSKDALLKATYTLKPLDPQVLVAAPATVLANRPDVRASERRLAATLSGKRAAISDFFPRISLLGFYGVQTSTLFDATPWSVGAQAIQPLLNFGRLRSQLKAASARQSQAFYGYQQTILEALEDMENSLSGFFHEYDRNRSLNTAVAQNRRAAELAKLQFTGGLTGLLDVLIAERNVLDAESNLAVSDAALRKNLVNIYAAAGGGWNTAEEEKLTQRD
jgi:NodT family efflux transporter outer membrane factor (OMF) lipoprotein